MHKTLALQERFNASIMPNYGTPAVALSHGSGCTLYDVDGNEYLDFVGGIAVSSLGHAHPALVEAVGAQVARLAHTSNLFLHQPEVELAEKLLQLAGAPGKVFFANSGAEANEAALKLALAHAARSGKNYVVAAEEGFHGRTLGALALTGKESIRKPFGPFGLDVRFVPYGDAAALQQAVADTCAAVFLEPVQGEAGVVSPPEGYLAAARRACDAAGAMFVADEVQSGVGRTGAWFAYQHTEVTPDVVTLAKGLGGGLPIGACLAFGEYADLFDKGAHGSTFGGNPVAAAAASAVLHTVESDRLVDNAAAAGEALADGVRALRHPLIAEVRGHGLWLGLELTVDVASAVEAALRAAGILVNPVRANVIRLAPPLLVSRGEVNRFLDALPGALDSARSTGDLS